MKLQGSKKRRSRELNKEFAAGVPELKFNPAENLSFLLEHRLSPGEAIDNNGDMDEGIRDEEREVSNEV